MSPHSYHGGRGSDPHMVTAVSSILLPRGIDGLWTIVPSLPYSSSHTKRASLKDLAVLRTRWYFPRVSTNTANTEAGRVATSGRMVARFFSGSPSLLQNWSVIAASALFRQSPKASL